MNPFEFAFIALAMACAPSPVAPENMSHENGATVEPDRAACTNAQ